MRCVKNIICTEFRSAGKFLHEDGGQSLGEHVYEYALSFGEEPFRAAERFTTPVKAVQISRGEGKELPPAKSCLSVENAVVSAIKRAADGDGYIVRMHNPTDTTVSVDLAGTEVSLAEEAVGAFNGEIKPYKIVSVKVK